MRQLLKVFLWLLAGGLIGGVGLIVYAFAYGVVPYDPDINEFDILLDFSPAAQDAMQPVLKGGHFFIFDGQDIWMRFHVTDLDVQYHPELATFLPEFSEFSRCRPDEMTTVRNWFLRRVSRPTLLPRLTPWSELSATDQASLTAIDQLDCIYYSGLSDSAQAPPGSCGRWWLRNRQTNRVYVRWACYN